MSLFSSLRVVTKFTGAFYDLVDDGKGGKKPIKVGLAPVQREGMEYEFTVVIDLSVDNHIATAAKDRTSLFDGQHFIPSPETGATLRDWLDSGVDPVEASQALLNTLKAGVSATSTYRHSRKVAACPQSRPWSSVRFQTVARWIRNRRPVCEIRIPA